MAFFLIFYIVKIMDWKYLLMSIYTEAINKIRLIEENVSLQTDHFYNILLFCLK